WLLKNDDAGAPLGSRIAALREASRTLETKMGAMLPTFIAGRVEERTQELFRAGAPEALARKVAFLWVMESVPDIARIASETGGDLVKAARAFFAVTKAFRIGRIGEAARTL